MKTAKTGIKKRMEAVAVSFLKGGNDINVDDVTQERILAFIGVLVHSFKIKSAKKPAVTLLARDLDVREEVMNEFAWEHLDQAHRDYLISEWNSIVSEATVLPRLDDLQSKFVSKVGKPSKRMKRSWESTRRSRKRMRRSWKRMRMRMSRKRTSARRKNALGGALMRRLTRHRAGGSEMIWSRRQRIRVRSGKDIIVDV